MADKIDVENGIEGMEPEEVDMNPVTEVRIRRDGALVIERTRERPVTEVETHNIAAIQADLNRIDGVIAVWQAKRNPLQAILDEYDSMGGSE